MEFVQNINGIEVNVNFFDENINDVFLPLIDHLISLYKEKNRRIICFIAGEPGTGKSTLVSFLEYLFKTKNDSVKLQSIGMDGFHLYQDYLLTHTTVVDGKEIKLVNIKGNPMTFDVDRLKRKIEELVKEKTVYWPIYDRILHNPIEDKIEVNADIVILEGNYLLLNYPKWKDLIKYADCTVYLSADINMLKERIVNRKMATGVSFDKALEFVKFSDVKNAICCKENSVTSDLLLEIDKDGLFHIIKQ